MHLSRPSAYGPPEIRNSYKRPVYILLIADLDTALATLLQVPFTLFCFLNGWIKYLIMTLENFDSHTFLIINECLSKEWVYLYRVSYEIFPIKSSVL